MSRIEYMPTQSPSFAPTEASSTYVFDPRGAQRVVVFLAGLREPYDSAHLYIYICLYIYIYTDR